MSAKKPENEKIANIAPVGLRMPNALRERMEAARRSSGRSMNSEIVHRLTETFEFPPVLDTSSPPTRVTQQQYYELLEELSELRRQVREAQGEIHYHELAELSVRDLSILLTKMISDVQRQQALIQHKIETAPNSPPLESDTLSRLMNANPSKKGGGDGG